MKESHAQLTLTRRWKAAEPLVTCASSPPSSLNCNCSLTGKLSVKETLAQEIIEAAEKMAEARHGFGSSIPCPSSCS